MLVWGATGATQRLQPEHRGTLYGVLGALYRAGRVGVLSVLYRAGRAFALDSFRSRNILVIFASLVVFAMRAEAMLE